MGLGSVPGLVAVPKTEQLAQGLRVRHRQIQPTADWLIDTVFADATLALIAYSEVGVRLELCFLVTEQFQSRDKPHSVMEAIDGTCDFQHQRSFRGDPSGVLTECQRVTAFVEHGTKPPKDRFQPLALPGPVRQAQITSLLFPAAVDQIREWGSAVTETPPSDVSWGTDARDRSDQSSNRSATMALSGCSPIARVLRRRTSRQNSSASA